MFAKSKKYHLFADLKLSFKITKALSQQVKDYSQNYLIISSPECKYPNSSNKEETLEGTQKTMKLPEH